MPTKNILTLALFTLILISLLMFQDSSTVRGQEPCSTFAECDIEVFLGRSGASSGISGSYRAAILTCPDGREEDASEARYPPSPTLEEAREICGVDSVPPTEPSNPDVAVDLTNDTLVCELTGDSINIRSGPSINFEPALGALNSGEVFIATGQNNGWYTGFYNDQPAWVSAAVVEANGNCDTLPFAESPPIPPAPSDDNNCSNFVRLVDYPEVERGPVTFSWSPVSSAGSYELVIYDSTGGVAGTFFVTDTTSTINLGDVPIGPAMAWEVRAFAPDGAYLCVSNPSLYSIVVGMSPEPPQEPQVPLSQPQQPQQPQQPKIRM